MKNNIKNVFNKTLQVLTSPSVILIFGLVGATLKACHEINEYMKQNRKIGFKR